MASLGHRPHSQILWPALNSLHSPGPVPSLAIPPSVTFRIHSVSRHPLAALLPADVLRNSLMLAWGLGGVRVPRALSDGGRCAGTKDKDLSPRAQPGAARLAQRPARAFGGRSAEALRHGKVSVSRCRGRTVAAEEEQRRAARRAGRAWVGSLPAPLLPQKALHRPSPFRPDPAYPVASRVGAGRCERGVRVGAATPRRRAPHSLAAPRAHDRILTPLGPHRPLPRPPPPSPPRPGPPPATAPPPAPAFSGGPGHDWRPSLPAAAAGAGLVAEAVLRRGRLCCQHSGRLCCGSIAVAWGGVWELLCRPRVWGCESLGLDRPEERESVFGLLWLDPETVWYLDYESGYWAFHTIRFDVERDCGPVPPNRIRHGTRLPRLRHVRIA
jgi:hypothetical protein